MIRAMPRDREQPDGHGGGTPALGSPAQSAAFARKGTGDAGAAWRHATSRRMPPAPAGANRSPHATPASRVDTHAATSGGRPRASTAATDVNPAVQRVVAPARRSVEVVTFIGSPARVFSPKVSCELR